MLFRFFQSKKPVAATTFETPVEVAIRRINASEITRLIPRTAAGLIPPRLALKWIQENAADIELVNAVGVLLSSEKLEQISFASNFDPIFQIDTPSQRCPGNDLV